MRKSIRGQVLFRGRVSWTENEDAAKTLDVTGGPMRDYSAGEKTLCSVRNESAVVDLVVKYGSFIKGGIPDPPPSGVACTMNNTGDTVTSTAHGLLVGDAITFGATTGGVTVGTVYYVIAVSDANTFQFATARGAAAFTITADGANTWSVAGEFYLQGTVTVEKFTAGSSTAAVGGLEEWVWEGGPLPGRAMFCKSAATAPAFAAFLTVKRV